MEDYLVVKMPKEIDHHTAGELSQALDYKIEYKGIRNLIFDFSETEFMDSSGIGILIGRSRKLKAYRGKVSAIHLGRRVKRIFLTSGLDKIIEMEEE